MEIKPQFRKKSIRSYVVRAGRMTEGQRNAFETSWPVYGLSLEDGLIDASQVFGRSVPLVVEIGFGMGDSLLEMAKCEPGKNFIGIEVHPPGVGRLINNARLDQVANLRVYMADANDVLKECFPDNSINRLQLYFPDPWHKKKHNKRRIVQSAFIHLVRQKLCSDGLLHMATDWEPYAEQMLDVMNSVEGFENCAGSGQYSERPAYRPETKFERRGARLGHGVWDLLFRAR